MFTENELVNFTTLMDYFKTECRRVVNELKNTTNGFYHYLGDCDEFIYNSEFRRVDCYSDRYRNYFGSFPVYFLLKSGEEIRRIVDQVTVSFEDLDLSKLKTMLDKNGG